MRVWWMVCAVGCFSSPRPRDSGQTAPVPWDSGREGSVNDGGGSSGDGGGVVSGPLEVSIHELSDAYDECSAQLCFGGVATRGGVPQPNVEVWVEAEGVGIITEGLTDLDGDFSGCTTSLTPGIYALVVTFRHGEDELREETQVDIRPFGRDLGFQKPAAPLAAVPFVPTMVRHAGNPIFSAGDTGEWDANGVLLASVAHLGDTHVMAYAGTAASDYEVGVATSTDGLSWTRVPENPVIPAPELAVDDTGFDAPDSWQRYATNSPFLMLDGGSYKLFYTGRRGETGDLSVGVATSNDGLRWSQFDGNPLISWDAANDAWEGNGVAHPSVIARDGFYELWYSTGKHHVAYALSEDGVAWTKYCNNPVLSGNEHEWDNGQVKSSEVIYDGDLYWMTYSGGGAGAFQVGWAASADGVHWVTHPEPILKPPAAGTWESNSVLGGSLLLEGDVLRMWYSGTSAQGSAIGYAEAAWAP